MKRWMLCVVLALVAVFIWNNSFQSEGTSDGISLVFTKWLIPFAQKLGFYGSIWQFNHLVRKMAHVTEFTVLGCILYHMVKRYTTYGVVWKSIGLGVVVAIIDECIQIFSPGRSAQVSDVVLDTIGSIVGIGLAKLIAYIIACICRDHKIL